jgi:phosphopantetheinyl transferase (holo-ACP synthase)
MQIDNDTKGKPVLRFLDAAGPLVKRLQIGNCLISLSDEKHYVVAMAVLET